MKFAYTNLAPRFGGTPLITVTNRGRELELPVSLIAAPYRLELNANHAFETVLTNAERDAFFDEYCTMAEMINRSAVEAPEAILQEIGQKVHDIIVTLGLPERLLRHIKTAYTLPHFADQPLRPQDDTILTFRRKEYEDLYAVAVLVKMFYPLANTISRWSHRGVQGYRLVHQAIRGLTPIEPTLVKLDQYFDASFRHQETQQGKALAGDVKQDMRDYIVGGRLALFDLSEYGANVMAVVRDCLRLELSRTIAFRGTSAFVHDDVERAAAKLQYNAVYEPTPAPVVSTHYDADQIKAVTESARAAVVETTTMVTAMIKETAVVTAMEDWKILRAGELSPASAEHAQEFLANLAKQGFTLMADPALPVQHVTGETADGRPLDLYGDTQGIRTMPGPDDAAVVRGMIYGEPAPNAADTVRQGLSARGNQLLRNSIFGAYLPSGVKPEPADEPEQRSPRDADPTK